ncbi:MAG: recombinase family protein [Holophagales bacterium]|jgi:DNA invertase Pin-like site-specific DNA recombinase|nr:recombinase family protein [Holophagales bacterium]
MRHETTNHQGGALHNTTGPSPKALKVALYARVSGGHQAKSLETQIQILRDTAKQRGMEVVWEETEIVSGAASKLPKRDALLEKSRQMGFNVVMATYLDRFGRSKVNTINALDALEEAGVNFISVLDNVDYSTPAGKTAASRLAEIAEFEIGRTRNRTIDGRKAAVSKGVKLGRPSALNDEKEREVVIALGEKKKQVDIARQFGVSQGTVCRIKKKRKRLQQQGAAEPSDGPQLRDEKDEPVECRPQFVGADAPKVRLPSSQFLMRRYRELTNA